MLKHSGKRAATSIRLLCEAAAERNLDTDACLRGTGLSAQDLHRTEARVLLAQEITAIGNFLRLAPDRPGLGVEIGRRYPVTAFGIWGFAILSSPTLRAAIETAIVFANLSFMIADMALSKQNESPKVVYDTSRLPANIRRFVLERHLTVMLSFLDEVLPELDRAALTILLRDTDPAYARILSDLLGVRARPGAQVDGMALPASLIDLPLPKSDPVTWEYCLNQCRTLLDDQQVSLKGCAHRVRNAIVSDLGAAPSISDVASKLAMSERTLRRRLEEEGTTFRAIAVDVRLAIAHDLLDTAALTVDAVASRVGYAESASFLRAFAKKYGKTPGEIRRRALQRAREMTTMP